MKKTWEEIWKITVALVLCITMLAPSATVFYATESVEPRATVYDSKAELFSAMRKALLPREKVDVEFEITERLRDEICYYDELYHQYFLKDSNYGRIIFDFNGDQMSIPANEGDYLQQSMIGSSSIGNISSGSWGTTIDLEVGSFMTTAAQEATFESALKGLFASGGALASAKGLSKADAVVACMNYINANVTGISSWKGEDHSAYGALCKGQATCQGKALLLYRMLRELGIANRILMGVDAAAHTYNIVLIDGKYYYCDPSTTTVILKGSNSFIPATLQEHYQTDAFKSGVLSKISASDYPLSTSGGSQGGGTTGSGSGGSTQTPATPSQPSTPSTPNTPSTSTPDTNGEQTKPVEYKVLDGAESTYEAEAKEFSLRAEGALEKFVSVEVDGKEIDKKYYTVKEGSTIVIFTKEFMDTLSEGEHTVTFNFTDGKASANIKVAAKAPVTEDVEDESTEDVTEDVLEENTENKDTNKSDNAKPDKEKKDGVPDFVWVILVVVLVVAGAAGVIWYRKKNGSGSEE